MTDRHELYDRIATLTTAAAAREADREEARDALEAAGHPGAHIDDWPRIAPAVHALIAERDALRRDLADIKANRHLWVRAVERASALAEHWAGDRTPVDRSTAADTFATVLELHGWEQTDAEPRPVLRAVPAPPQPNPDTTQENR